MRWRRVSDTPPNVGARGLIRAAHTTMREWSHHHRHAIACRQYFRPADGEGANARLMAADRAPLPADFGLASAPATRQARLLRRLMPPRSFSNYTAYRSGRLLERQVASSRLLFFEDDAGPAARAPRQHEVPPQGADRC